MSFRNRGLGIHCRLGLCWRRRGRILQQSYNKTTANNKRWWQQMRGVPVPVGTRKGAFVLTSAATREHWEIAGPCLSGWDLPCRRASRRRGSTLSLAVEAGAHLKPSRSAPSRLQVTPSTVRWEAGGDACIATGLVGTSARRSPKAYHKDPRACEHFAGRNGRRFGGK
jgi:hypothetical protein